jgi:hypothetical protein
VHVFLAVAVVVVIAMVANDVLNCSLKRLVIVLCRKWDAAFPSPEEIVAYVAVHLEAIVDGHS